MNTSHKRLLHSLFWGGRFLLALRNVLAILVDSGFARDLTCHHLDFGVLIMIWVSFRLGQRDTI